ncbi:MAG: hypothetical protein CMG80_05220 [Marinobacter sp.]|nr:hypothetical protein [Marinobacter sp.]
MLFLQHFHQQILVKLLFLQQLLLVILEMSYPCKMKLMQQHHFHHHNHLDVLLELPKLLRHLHHHF